MTNLSGGSDRFGFKCYSVALLRFAHADSFLSGAGREADKKMGHQAGANAYVIKPDVSHLLGVFTFESPVSLDPLAPELEGAKPRGEGAKDEQHAEYHKKNRKSQNEK